MHMCFHVSCFHDNLLDRLRLSLSPSSRKSKAHNRQLNFLAINGISICHYGARPRFLDAPPLMLNLPLMASKETIEQVKNLLKQELSPINAKLDGLTTKLSDIETTVNFLSGKYDALLNQLKDTNRKVNSHASDVAKVKENLKEIEKPAYSASSEVEQIAKYLRRDCLEITGISTNEECSAEGHYQINRQRDRSTITR